MPFRSFRKFAVAAAVCSAAIQMTSANLQAQTVQHASFNGNYKLFLTLVSRDSRVRILVDDADYACVKKAADMFCSDLKAITGREDAAKVENELRYSTKEALVVVGTLGHSKFIDQLVEKGKIDVSQIKGKWEHTLTACVRDPFNSGEDALVIAA